MRRAGSACRRWSWCRKRPAHAHAPCWRAGAEVCVHDLSFQEANAHAQSLLAPQDAFIHPFDDPLLWEGHAGMIDEVARAGLRPDAVVLSVGGGGLLRAYPGR
jgi:L-serine/L-threonine ammonia-lyase